MNRPLWKEALTPTLLLGGLWLAFGLATTAYIAWLDRSYQRLVDDNVTSMHSAGEVQGILWSLHDAMADASESVVSEAAAKRIEGELQRLRSALHSTRVAAKTDQERREAEILERSAEEYLLLFEKLVRSESPTVELRAQTRDRSRELAVEMSARCNRLREINQGLINDETEQRQAWTDWIGGTRFVLLFLGPVLGVWTGVRAASRAHRRLTEIRFKLEGAAGELGRLEVSSNPDASDFDDLDRQVMAITQRLQDVVQELQSARHEVMRSERLAAVGQLAAGVAHELRNPLTAVKLLVQTVAREHHDDATTAKQLGVVQKEVIRMERTIQSLLDFARPPAQNRLRHDLRDTLGRAMNLMEGHAVRDRVRIELVLPDEPFELDGDPEQLHQVFVNLLLNGIDAMPDGGQICVTLQRAPPTARLDDSPGRPCVVTVSDGGAGIPDSVMEHLFEPFVTSKERGTGLGLAVSRRIIEEHGGTLTAANGPNGGAVFSVKLPMIAQPEPVELVT